MAVGLPQELVDSVIDYLEGDVASLKVCSLLSRAWVPHTRSYLFENCFIDPENIFLFRELLRSPYCTFAPHVRSLSAERRYKHNNDAGFDDVVPDLRLLENVRTLKMQLSIVVNATDVDAFFRTGFVAAWPKVTHLVLTGYGHGGAADYSQRAPLIETICLFPALQSLHMQELPGMLAAPPASAVPPPGLRSLNLGFNSPVPILAWLQSFDHLPNIDSLTLLPTIRQSDLPILRGVLQQLGGALHYLEIQLLDGQAMRFYDSESL
ncbi:hypothetical protein C8R45DRAFT_1020403, partial [Mycena sanguinolenta]